MEQYKLTNEVMIPCLGYGTYKLINSSETIDKIELALQCGYRLIDSATIYENEESIGKAIKKWNSQFTETKRSELFITSKVANEDQGYYSTLKAFDTTLNKLELDYLDLYLIHWPVPRYKEECYQELNIETWKAMDELCKKEKVKAIGVSNFLQRHIENLIKNTNIKPMVNQLEIHPRFQQRELVSYCQNNNILIEAWGPFRSGLNVEDDNLKQIAAKYKKTIPQLCIKWNIQKGIVPLPKSSTKNHMLANLDVFDFTISREDISIIESLDTNTRHVDSYNYVRQKQY